MLIDCSKLYQKLVAIFMMCCMHAVTYAQPPVQKDTLIFSLDAIDRNFLDTNLQLLAAHYNVDAQKALIHQAKLWSNPILITDQVISAAGRMFPYGKNPDGTYSGQYFIQVQQLISTAGKRGKLIDLATTNAKMSELQLQDVLRNLRIQLHTDYYTLVQQFGILNIYHDQFDEVSKLLDGMQAQYKTGNIALKDLLRVQALVISLQQDMNEVNRNIEDAESDLKALLRSDRNIFIKPVDKNNDTGISLNVTPENCIDSARRNNPNYLLQQSQLLYQQQNLTYQKALRAPDLTVGPEFDRNSNFAPNYIGLTISLPLPVLNKNQGNIESAAFAVKQQEALNSNADVQLTNNVMKAYNKLVLLMQQNNAVQKDFYTGYEKMFDNMLRSYQQKQISLLEFLDFFDAYKEAHLKLLQQQRDLQLSKEELNYETGTTIIP
jgi:outer membrane protein, heavy metal efflux system